MELSSGRSYVIRNRKMSSGGVQADEDPGLRPGVEGGGGFIHHQQCRLPVEGSGEDESPSLPAGELLSAEPLAGR